MRNILIFAQWDGTDFCGWQSQQGLRTVQGELGLALQKMVHHEVTLYGSSRTDSGVHARAMPINFETPRDIAPENYIRGLNTFLPLDLSVIDAREVPLGWRAREESVAKTYTYRLQTGPRRAISDRFTWYLKRRLGEIDIDKMREAARYLIGEHDFAAFRSIYCDAKTTTRCMHEVSISDVNEDGQVDIIVTGNAFMRNMVRIMVGTLVEVGTKRHPADWVAHVLASKERTEAGSTAPACGLTLTKVHFDGYPRLGKRSSYKPVDTESLDSP